MDNLKFCRKCGTQLQDNAKFCIKCGTPVQEADNAPGSEEIKNRSSNLTVKQRKQGGLTKYIILGSVLAIAVVAGSVLLVNSQNSLPEQSLSSEQADSENQSEDLFPELIEDGSSSQEKVQNEQPVYEDETEVMARDIYYSQLEDPKKTSAACLYSILTGYGMTVSQDILALDLRNDDEYESWKDIEGVLNHHLAKGNIEERYRYMVYPSAGIRDEDYSRFLNDIRATIDSGMSPIVYAVPSDLGTSDGSDPIYMVVNGYEKTEDGTITGFWVADPNDSLMSWVTGEELWDAMKSTYSILYLY